MLIWHRMNHSVKRRRQALHKTHHHYYLNISVEAANLSDWRIESNRKNRFGSENRIESKLFARIGMLYCLITLPECMTSLWDACSSSFCISELYTIQIVAATLITPPNSKHKYYTRRITLLSRLHPLLFDLHWWKNSQVFGILIIETVVKLGWACPGHFTN